MQMRRRSLLKVLAAFSLSLVIPLTYQLVLVVAADPPLPLSLTVNGGSHTDVWEGDTVSISAWMNCAGEGITVTASGASPTSPYSQPDPFSKDVTYPNASNTDYTVSATSPAAANPVDATVAVVDISLSSTVPTSGVIGANETATITASITAPSPHDINWVMDDQTYCANLVPLSNPPRAVVTAGNAGGTIEVRAEDSLLNPSLQDPQDIAIITVIKVEITDTNPPEICLDGASTSILTGSIEPSGRTINWSIVSDSTSGATLSATAGPTTDVIPGTSGGVIEVRAQDSVYGSAHFATTTVTAVDVDIVDTDPTSICVNGSSVVTASVAPPGRQIDWTIVSDGTGGAQLSDTSGGSTSVTAGSDPGTIYVTAQDSVLGECSAATATITVVRGIDIKHYHDHIVPGCSKNAVVYFVDAPFTATGAALEVYDSVGMLVRTVDIESGDATPGTHTVMWDGKDNNGDALPFYMDPYDFQMTITDGARTGESELVTGIGLDAWVCAVIFDDLEEGEKWASGVDEETIASSLPIGAPLGFTTSVVWLVNGTEDGSSYPIPYYDVQSDTGDYGTAADTDLCDDSQGTPHVFYTTPADDSSLPQIRYKMVIDLQDPCLRDRAGNDWDLDEQSGRQTQAVWTFGIGSEGITDFQENYN